MKIKFPMQAIAWVLGASFFVAAQADAKPGKGKGGPDHSHKENKEQKGKGKGNDGEKPFKKPDAPGAARFSDDERNEIVSYFGRFQKEPGGLPPGLAMNQRRGKPLPPGWQKKLVPGYRIDDESWLSFAPVPVEWFPGLRLPADTRLYHYGDRVVRVYEPRREIVEVIILPGL